MEQTFKKKITNKQAVAGIVLSLIFLSALAFVMERSMRQAWQEDQVAAAILSLQEEFTTPQREISASLQAQSAIVYDLRERKVLYSKNPDAQLPLASLTKLITALVAEREVGGMAPVTVTEEALMTEGESGLIAGDIWREQDISDFMLTVSSNDAATVLATLEGDTAGFVKSMNTFTKERGLATTVLLNESGLDVDLQQAGGYGSARDIANLLAYIVKAKPRLLEATAYPHFTSVSMTGAQYEAVNTNKIVSEIPGFIGGKTGFTDIAGGNLAIVFDAGIGHQIVIVVLGSTKEGRFTDVLQLVHQLI